MVYTSITGGYEKGRNDIVVMEYDPFKDPRRSARMHKCLAPKGTSVWIDGNMTPKVSEEELLRYLGDNDIAVFKHPIRDCIYDEGWACSELSLDDCQVITAQLGRYRREGYPAHNGLAATNCVIRKDTPKIQELNNLWWAEICKGSRRDQLSFDYCCWKLGIRYSIIPGEWNNNELFTYKTHGQ